MSERSVRWPAYYIIMLLLLVAVFISYVDRTNISVGAIAMQALLGWTETQKGMVLSSFFIGYLLLMLVSSALANRFGGKIVLGVAVVWWSLFTALTPPAALVSLSALVLARIGLGMGEAAVFPACINMIGRWVPPLQRSGAVALVTSAAPLSTRRELLPRPSTSPAAYPSSGRWCFSCSPPANEKLTESTLRAMLRQCRVVADGTLVYDLADKYPVRLWLEDAQHGSDW